VLQQFYGHHYHHSQNGRSGHRISVKARFSAHVQISPGDSLSLLYNGHRVSFSGVKRLGRGADHPPPSSAEVKGRIELYFYSLSGPSWPVLGPTFTNTAAATTAFDTWVFSPLLPDLFLHRESCTPKSKAAAISSRIHHNNESNDVFTWVWMDISPDRFFSLFSLPNEKNVMKKTTKYKIGSVDKCSEVEWRS